MGTALPLELMPRGIRKNCMRRPPRIAVLGPATGGTGSWRRAMAAMQLESGVLASPATRHNTGFQSILWRDL